jgi:ubiquinone/menaquinone biosynthesis C-methylase UbiE
MDVKITANTEIKMKYSTFFSKQAKNPTGLFGRFYMSRVFDKGNFELNTLMYKILSVKEDDHILEMGSGTGALVKKIADQLTTGMIEGVDLSKPMAKLSQKKNRNHIKNGRAKFHLGDFDEITFDLNCFDKIFSVNTLYFWKNPNDTISKMCRVLKHGGQLIIGFHDKSEMEKMPLNKDVFKYYSTNDLVKLLSIHGSLNNIDIISKKGEGKTCHCAIATKSKV